MVFQPHLIIFQGHRGFMQDGMQNRDLKTGKRAVLHVNSDHPVETFVSVNGKILAAAGGKRGGMGAAVVPVFPGPGGRLLFLFIFKHRDLFGSCRPETGRRVIGRIIQNRTVEQTQQLAACNFNHIIAAAGLFQLVGSIQKHPRLPGVFRRAAGDGLGFRCQ